MKPKKKEDTRGRHALTTKQRERRERGEKIDISEKGLKLSWITFLDAYVANGGDGTAAWKIAYPETTSDEVARASASRLLANVNVKEELRNKLESQRCTDDWVRNKLMGLVELHYSGKGAIVSEKALETLAKIKGMLTENHKFAFDGMNPAVFASPISSDEKQKMDEEAKNAPRITE